jgi:hypothetical protein
MQISKLFENNPPGDSLREKSGVVTNKIVDGTVVFLLGQQRGGIILST